MTKPGHNYLPLGPAFQEHVACFLKYVSSTAKLLLHMQPPGCKEMGSYQGVKKMPLGHGQVEVVVVWPAGSVAIPVFQCLPGHSQFSRTGQQAVYT